MDRIDNSPYLKHGPPPGAPAEDDPVRDQIARAVEKASPVPNAAQGVFGPEGDKNKFPAKVSITNKGSVSTPKDPLT